MVLGGSGRLYVSFFHSPVFVVSNVLLIASPPALTLAQVSLFTFFLIIVFQLLPLPRSRRLLPETHLSDLSAGRFSGRIVL